VFKPIYLAYKCQASARGITQRHGVNSLNLKMSTYFNGLDQLAFTDSRVVVKLINNTILSHLT
jgi:hypothetical protein